MDLTPTKIQVNPVDENQWLGSEHGTDSVRSITLDLTDPNWTNFIIADPIQTFRKYVKAGVPVYNPATSVATTTALVNGGATTAIATAALPFALAAGATVTITSGANTQNFVVAAGGAAAGAVSIPVNSQNANFAYPVGSAVTSPTQWPATGLYRVATGGANPAVGHVFRPVPFRQPPTQANPPATVGASLLWHGVVIIAQVPGTFVPGDHALANIAYI